MWRIRKAGNLLGPKWRVHDPDGSWAGNFDTHADAVCFVDGFVGFADTVEQWLMQQVP